MSVTDDSSISDTEFYAIIDRLFERAQWDYLGTAMLKDELSGLPEPLLVAVQTALRYMVREGSDPSPVSGIRPVHPDLGDRGQSLGPALRCCHARDGADVGATWAPLSNTRRACPLSRPGLVC